MQAGRARLPGFLASGGSNAASSLLISRVWIETFWMVDTYPFRGRTTGCAFCLRLRPGSSTHHARRIEAEHRVVQPQLRVVCLGVAQPVSLVELQQDAVR